MARLTLILGVLATVIYLLDGFRFVVNEWRNWRNKGTWLVVVGLVLMPSLADAVCSGSSPTWTAASPEEVDVQACHTVASNGDIINVPAGTGTWVSTVFTKSVTVLGAGSSNTIITGRFSLSGATRVSGFTFNFSGSNRLLVNTSQGFRVDHNIINTQNLEVWGSAAIATEGLIDHNTITDGKVLFFGSVDSEHGNARWAEAENLGTVHAIYIEDNVFNVTSPGGGGNSIDGNWGARTVARFNTFNSGRIEQHGLQGQDERGVRIWELYGNDLNTSLGTAYRPFFIRGATGVIFHNHEDGGFTLDTIDIDGPRLIKEGSYPSWGWCDGTSFADQNTATFEGWACRDQIGRSTDASLWDFSDPSPAQTSSPAYFWNNIRTDTSGLIPAHLNTASSDPVFNIRMNGKQILANRDYYDYTTSFDGTSGTGEGVLASRPATCTIGVGYWATDQGSWNVSTSNPYGVQANGEDGVLYLCTSTNTWTLSYTPYIYPHPLQGITDTPATSPVVIARVFRWMEVAAFVTGMGWHFRKPLMTVCLAAIAGWGTLYQLAPRSYDTVKVVSKDSAVKVLTVFNHLTKPRM